MHVLVVKNAWWSTLGIYCSFCVVTVVMPFRSQLLLWCSFLVVVSECYYHFWRRHHHTLFLQQELFSSCFPCHSVYIIVVSLAFVTRHVCPLLTRQLVSHSILHVTRQTNPTTTTLYFLALISKSTYCVTSRLKCIQAIIRGSMRLQNFYFETSNI